MCGAVEHTHLVLGKPADFGRNMRGIEIETGALKERYFSGGRAKRVVWEVARRSIQMMAG